MFLGNCGEKQVCGSETVCDTRYQQAVARPDPPQFAEVPLWIAKVIVCSSWRFLSFPYNSSEAGNLPWCYQNHTK